MRVRVGAGTGVELLVAAIAVADPDWRTVFSHGAAAYDAALAAEGRDLVRDVGRIGRHGWVHLLGPLTRLRGAWSVEALRAEAARLAPGDLRDTLLGSRGQTTRWLARADAKEVRRSCLHVLESLPAPVDRAPVLSRVRARLAEVGPEQLLDEVAPGLHYGPGVLADVVLVTSPQVAPIVVELAGPDRTVIVHPPLGEAGATDAGARLRDLGRAMGDGTRMRVLHLLKGGESTLVELCAALDAPRTTLLHHLALLRGAGLVDLSVTAGEPNVYRLRLEGFDELGQVARAFPLQ
jgi:DNA-binding transcriptional ArsR family regulator